MRFNIALGISGSLDAFHTQVDLSLVTSMCVKVVALPSVRDSILAIIENYILGKDYLIQLDVAHICWIYQQVLMYNLSMNSFKKYTHLPCTLHVGYSSTWVSTTYTTTRCSSCAIASRTPRNGLSITRK